MACCLSLFSMRSKRFWKGAGIVSAEMLSTMAIFTGVLAGLVFAIRPYMRRHKKTDLAVFDLVQKHTNDRNTKLMLTVTHLANHRFLIPANLSLITYFLFVRRRTWFSIRVASIALSSLGLMFLLKHLFRRKRPSEPLLFRVKGLSFPSGHAIMSVTFYGLLIYITSNTVRSALLKGLLTPSLVALILMIGYSRVYLRVHYASDVIAGHTVGLLWLLIALDLLKRIEEYNKKQNLLPAKVLIQ
jgi:membrane-associated phospholipid phosphatase